MANVAQRMEYVGNAAPTTLAGDLPDSGTSFSVTDATNYPTGTVGQFTLVINKGGATEEKVLCTIRVNGQFTVAANGRGYDGTVAQTHSSGESVAVCWTASAADADNLHNASSSAVHGVAGSVVGTTDVQVLFGKTLDGGANTFTNIPQAAVSGLSTSLAALTSGKLANPATAWAKGSILAGTGAGTYDTEAVGVDNAVLTADSTATGGVSWKTPTAGLLAWARGTATGVSKSSSGGGLSAIDSTGATVTFTAPASGKVLVKISANAHGNNPGFIGATLHGSSTIVAGLRDPVNGASTTVDNRYVTTVPVTGLTAGTSYSYDAAGGCDGSNGCTFGAAMIEVWSA